MGDTARSLLYTIAERTAEFRTRTETANHISHVIGTGHDENLGNACATELPDGVIDHRLPAHREQVLVRSLRQWVQTKTLAASENDSFHGESIASRSQLAREAASAVYALHMRTLLVTGGAGFIGSNFIRLLLEERSELSIVNLDKLTYAGHRDTLRDLETHPRHHFVHGDIRDLHMVTRLLKEEQIDTIVHFAAESHVDRSISGPDEFIDTNIIGTHQLLKAAKSSWLPG